MCRNCGKAFYIYGRAGDYLGKLLDARVILKHYGYYTENIPSPYEIIQDRAKCCDNPDLSVIIR